MRFEVEHRFEAPLAAVEVATLDPVFYGQVRLPDVGPPRVVEFLEDGDEVHLSVAYEFVGHLPSVARAVLGTGRLSWVNATVANRATHRAEFRVIPDVHAERITCAGQIELTADGDGGTRRRIRGDMTVRVPLLASRAERAISSGLIERLDVEAESLRRYLAP